LIRSQFPGSICKIEPAQNPHKGIWQFFSSVRIGIPVNIAGASR